MRRSKLQSKLIGFVGFCRLLQITKLVNTLVSDKHSLMSMRLLQQHISRSASARHSQQFRNRSAAVRCYSSGLRSKDTSSYNSRERSQSYQPRQDTRDKWQREDRGRDDRRSWPDRNDRDRRPPPREQRPVWGRDRDGPADRPVTSTSLLQDNWVGDAVYGVNPVLAALKFSRRSLYSLHVQDGLRPVKKQDQTAVSQAVQAAKDAGAAVNTASKLDLNIISGNRPHQGLVLDCSPLSFVPIDRLEDAMQSSDDLTKPPLWLVLDEVMDPQNFGAALRSAHFLGANGVLTCSRNSAPLSPVVSKASAGAMEAMPVYSAQNLPRTLAAAAESGWQVIGAASEASSVNCLDVQMTQPTLLVLGNEGVGLRTTVRNICHKLVKVDTGHKTEFDNVDSLNVSVATGILLHQLLSSRTERI